MRNPALAKIQFDAPGAPVVYAHYEDGQLHLARSTKDLQAATPLQPEKTGKENGRGTGVLAETRTYREVRLPVSVEGFESMHLKPTVTTQWEEQGRGKQRSSRSQSRSSP